MRRSLKLFTFSLLMVMASLIHGCGEYRGKGGLTEKMKTYYFGRFLVSVPAAMGPPKSRSATLRYVHIDEIAWPKDINHEKARMAEWQRFVTETRSIPVPNGARDLIIRSKELPAGDRWGKGVFYYDGNWSSRIGVWTLLIDVGERGVWFKGEPSVVERELQNPKMSPNIENVARKYQTMTSSGMRAASPATRFYLQDGFIDLPYLEEESANLTFEGHPLALTLRIDTKMDFRHRVQKRSVIQKTRAVTAAALLVPNSSMSSVRLHKREVAGMPGEEAVLKVKDGDSQTLLFTWEYSGKDNSGEYPKAKIEMESPDQSHLHQKLAIWDAILDSMQPTFERKK